MLLLLTLLPVVFSKDIPVGENFIIKHVESCPEEGYYFRRELSPNSTTPGHCYLCFCQNDGTAACWRRENRRCDLEGYHYHNIGKRDNRVRRGIGLGDIFLRDAARDFFNKQLPEQCKPYESSFSEGCPPADWCIGCTVCDCDANGRWDCHILSYCPKKSTKKPAPNPRKGPARRTVIKRSAKKTNKSTKNKPKSKSKQTPKLKKNLPKNLVHKATNKNRPKRQPVKGNNQGKNKKIIQKRSKPPKKVVKKYIAKQSVNPRDPKRQILLPTSPKVAQAAVKKIIAAMQIIMRNDLKKGVSSKILKAVENKHNINVNNNKKATTQRIKQTKSTTKKIISQKNKARNKREANLVVMNSSEVNTASSLHKESLFVEDIMEKTTTEAIVTRNSLTTPVSLKLTTNNAVKPIDTDIKYFVQNITTPMNNILDGSYYKYLEHDNNTLTSTIQPAVLHSKDANLTSNYNVLYNKATPEITNFIINVSDINEDKEEEKGRMIYLLDRIPNVNDLKFKQWSKIKLLNDKVKHFKGELVKSKNIFSRQKAKTAELPSDTNKKAYGKHQVKKIGLSKKYNIKKLVNTSKIGRDKTIAMDKTNLVYVDNKITELQRFVKYLMNGFSKNNTIQSNRKSKQFNIPRYMRKLFRKIFHTRQKKLYKNEKNFLVKNYIIETLCEYFGPCKFNHKEKKLLEIKLQGIHRETAEMLKTINIIKGLLHLIDLPSNKNMNANKTKSSLNVDLLKLNSILKETYQRSLTETNALQIEYVKKNTQAFVQSVGNIATLLNEVIVIMNRTKNRDKYAQRSASTPVERNKSFTSIKNLLIKYNILHNTFLKRMYDAITVFESKSNQEKFTKANREDLGNIASINNFTNNIIANLRKVMRLAQKLNSKRQKRNVGRDSDAIEYLLMLMEYLLKQNYPLDAAPVNDGIDVLLETIKHSPDIKTIKKKVLVTPPIRFVETVRSMTVNELTGGKSESNINSTEDNLKSETNNTSKLDDTKLIEELEEDRDYEDKYTITKKSADISKKSIDNRSNNRLNKIKDEVDSTTGKEIVENIANGKFETNKTIFDSIDEVFSNKINSSKYEIQNVGLDDENQVTEISNTGSITEINMAVDKAKVETRVNNEDDRSASEIIKLDWLDEKAKDYKEYKSTIHLRSTTPSTIKSKIMHKITEDSVSAISKELKTEDRRKLAKINTDDVMLKKEVDLLNSLDYGTEKSNLEEDASKDISADERYPVDTFPAYFV